MTIEARTRTTIRQVPRVFARCDRCDVDVWMVTPHEGALLSLTNPRAIFRGVEAGTVHFIEGDAGDLLVCAHSLQPESSKRIGQ